MPIATVSRKGQVTLPARMRRKLGIKPQDRVVIETHEDAILIKRAKDLFELKGFLGKAKPAGEERAAMMKAVAEHVVGDRK